MSLAELGLTLFSVVTLTWSSLTTPARARCPSGWVVNGIRPTGHFTCLREPHWPEPDCRGVRSCQDEEPAYEFANRIYCRNGKEPRVLSFLNVGCR